MLDISGAGLIIGTGGRTLKISEDSSAVGYAQKGSGPCVIIYQKRSIMRSKHMFATGPINITASNIGSAKPLLDILSKISTSALTTVATLDKINSKLFCSVSSVA